MAIRELLRYGDPKLLSKSEIIEFPLDNGIKILIKDLKDTMIHHNGAELLLLKSVFLKELFTLVLRKIPDILKLMKFLRLF